MSQASQYLNQGEMMEWMGVSKTQLYQLRKRGLPYIALSRTLRLYPVEKVCEWLDKRIVHEE